MIQTNRTLLIEEIAPNKDNIISIIPDAEKQESLSDEEIKALHAKLEVSEWRRKKGFEITRGQKLEFLAGEFFRSSNA